MKILILLCEIILLFTFCNTNNNGLTENNLRISAAQLTQMLATLDNRKLNPRSVTNNNQLSLVGPADWTCGFFPGCLWYMYEYEGKEKWLTAGQQFTEFIEEEKYNKTTHDLGFKILSSFGNGYRLTGKKQYKQVILQSAKTLTSRFNPKIGSIRSWDHHSDIWQFPVIIDNMMNLELLFRATAESGDSTFYDIAVAHAYTTIKNHFRSDYSTWHVVDYNPESGEILTKTTHQGYSAESCWSRGQAWALYGFTMCYRETRDEKFLSQAKYIADFILNNKNFPYDGIPYWDFDAPDIPNEPRDASAAAVICAALYELSTFVSNENKNYIETADNILNTLSSPEYQAEPGTNNNYLLMNSVGSKPADSEVGVPLIYADYYFLEANMRKMKIENDL